MADSSISQAIESSGFCCAEEVEKRQVMKAGSGQSVDLDYAQSNLNILFYRKLKRNYLYRFTPTT